jgi:ribonucleoside-triphosphate reductase
MRDKPVEPAAFWRGGIMSDNRDVGVSPSETVSGAPENAHGPDRLVVDSLRRGRSEPYSRRRVVETFEKECGLDHVVADAFTNAVEAALAEREQPRITSSELRSLMVAELRARGFGTARRNLQVHGLSRRRLEEYARINSSASMPVDFERAAAGDVLHSYALDVVYSPEVAEAHLDGIIHIEGLRAPSRNIAGIYAIEPVKKFGIGYAPPARDARELGVHVAAFLSNMAEKYSDSIGQAFLNVLFAPFVAGMDYSGMRREAEALVFNVSRTDLARRGKVVLDLHVGIPHCLRDVTALGPNGMPTGKTYSDYSSESREFAWVLLDVLRDAFKAGDPALPKAVLHLSASGFSNPAEHDFVRFACTVAAQVGLPEFRFDRTGVSFLPCGSVDGSAPLDLERFRMTVAGIVVINLPQAAYRAGGNIEKFWFELDRAADIASHAHVEKLATMQAETFSGAGKISREFAVAVTGLNECVLHLTGSELHEAEDAHAAGLRILAFLDIKCRDLSKKSGLRFKLAEGSTDATRRFAEIDHKRFSEAARYVRGDKTRGVFFYTSGAGLRADAPVDVLRRIRVESTFHRVLPMCTVVALSEEETGTAIDGVFRVLEKTFKRTEALHLAIRTDASVCRTCGGFYPAIGTCTTCGADPGRKTKGVRKDKQTGKPKMYQPSLFPEPRE